MLVRERLHRALHTVVLVVVAIVMGVAPAGAAVAAAPATSSGAAQAVGSSTTSGVGEIACGVLGTVSPLSGLVCGVGEVISGGYLQDDTSTDSKSTSAGDVASSATSLVCTVSVVISPVLGLACPVIVNGVETVAAVADLILNPEHAYEYFANELKETAITWLTRAMTYVVNEASFDPAEDWWRDAYAATAGLGLVLMAVMFFTTLRKAAVGKIGPKKAATIVSEYLPTAILMMIFGPAIGYVVADLVSSLNAGIIEWLGEDAIDSLVTGAVFTQMTAAAGFGVALGLVLFLLLLMAVLGVFGTWIAQTLATYIFGAVAGLAWGMTIDPTWRKKALRVPYMVLGLMLAKPGGLLVIGIITKYVANIEVSSVLDDPTKLLVQGLTLIIALVMIAFCPWAVMRYMPLLPDGSDSVHSSGPSGSMSLATGLGSAMTTVLMMRASGARSGAGSGGAGSKGEGGTNPTKSGGARNQAGAQDKGAAGSRTGGAAGRSPATGGTQGQDQPQGPGGGSRGTAPGTSVGGAGGRAAGSAGGAGGGSAAGSAAGGASTGGALLVAQLAAAGVNAVANKAKEAASGAAPQVGGEVR